MTQVHVAPPGGWKPETVHPDRWADQMLKAWKVATYHKGICLEKRALSLSDIDKAEPGELVNTPKSLQACLLLGIDPEEVQFRDITYFTERGLPKAFQEMKFQYHEKERREKLARLLEERNRIISEHDTGSIFVADGKILTGAQAVSGQATKPTDSQAKAIKAAEAAKRRVEKETKKRAEAEAAKLRMQKDAARVAEMQRLKYTEQKAEKRRKEKEFQAQQAAIEEKRRLEEEELERKARDLAAGKYEEDLKLAKARAIAAKNAKKHAIQKARERHEKQEEFRKQLEKMQEDIMKQAIEGNKERLAKDEERKRIQAIKNAEIAKVNAMNRAEAEKRQAVAIQGFYNMLKRKRDDFDAKNAAHAVRQKEKQVVLDKEAREKRRMEEQKEKDRIQVLKNANERRENRIQEILRRYNVKSKLLHEYLIQRGKERHKTNVKNNLEYSNAQNIVKQTARKQALQRRQLLDHIEKATGRIRALLDLRLQIQKDRQLAEAKLMRAKGRL